MQLNKKNKSTLFFYKKTSSFMAVIFTENKTIYLNFEEKHWEEEICEKDSGQIKIIVKVSGYEFRIYPLPNTIAGTIPNSMAGSLRINGDRIWSDTIDLIY